MNSVKSKTALRLSCGSFVRTMPILDGSIAPGGDYALTVVPDPFPPSGLLEDYQARRNILMVEQRAFDVCEMGLAPLVAARARGHDLVAIPVFHYRRFRHSAIVCRTNARIQSPQHLIGKRIGVRRFSLSAGIWARGLLAHEYGLPLERIRWVVQVDTPLRDQIRDRVSVTLVPAGEPLENLLLRGELDATIEAFDIGPLRDRSTAVHPLFEHSAVVEIDYYRRTGIFPIMHTIVMQRSLSERFPDLPQELHAAFVRAKAAAAADPARPIRYVLAQEEREWIEGLAPDAHIAFMGDVAHPRDPWKYSLHEDGKTVETFLDYAFEQGLTTRRFALEELFVPSTLDL